MESYQNFNWESYQDFNWESYVHKYNLTMIDNKLSAWKNWINEGIAKNNRQICTDNGALFPLSGSLICRDSEETKERNVEEQSSEELCQNNIDNYFNNHVFKKCLVFYHTWPTINNAESECIYRFKHACYLANINFIMIDNNGTIINPNHVLNGININNINKKHIDALISIHWESPKNTDFFTVCFLWNPLEYYDNTSLNTVLKYDAYVSCCSNIIDKVIKLLRPDKNIIATVNHSISEPLLEYEYKNFKCFYIGINWELCTNKPTRYSKLLKLLDRDNLINIYGPDRFLGINIWNGYNNYVGEIPFDGLSIIKAISDTGICLVLSS